MTRSHRLWIIALTVASFALVLRAAGDNATAARGQQPPPGVQTPVVRYPLQHDLSLPLSQIPPQGVAASGEDVILPLELLPRPVSLVPESPSVDAAVQHGFGLDNMPSPEFNFAGLNNDDNLAALGRRLVPPDTIGDIGPNHYIQFVNVVFAIWEIDRQSQTVTRVYGPAAGHTLWSGFGGMCETHDNGDVIVLYDSISDRWLMSQFAIDFNLPEFHQCIAVSQTGDPTGAWYRYDYLMSQSKMNDYPKFGVWPDAYYLTINQFASSDWAGQGVAAFEREKMLAGQPAAMLYFDLVDAYPRLGAMLPADLDGSTPPPPGEPGYFVQFDDDASGYSPDQLQVWQFHVDWTDPITGTFGNPQIINLSAAGLSFDSLLCTEYRSTCIDQPATDRRLEDLADRLMYRLAYRNFGDYAALVVNHTVDTDGRGRAGVRWYELRLEDGLASLRQGGTYAPEGGAASPEHRWMGSAAMDASGNLALGYSVSGLSTYPSIRYTGRLAGDPLGVLPQGESTLTPGGGSQSTVAARWGDYSMMTVDPTDDCTFWYTNEYYPVSSLLQWHTRIGSFRFPSCTTGPRGSLQGIITDINTGAPLPDARVLISDSVVTLADGSGRYQFLNIPADSYAAAVWAYGYLPQSAILTVTNGSVIVHDFGLSPRVAVTAFGVVTDASGHGWPLYARLHITADGFDETVFTDPLSGVYQIGLFTGLTYRFEISAVSGGYHPQIVHISFSESVPSSGGEPTPANKGLSASQIILSPENPTADFDLVADVPSCLAPGYAPETVYSEDFEASDGGFTTAVSGTQAASTWAWGVPASGPLAAHSGDRVWATNLSGNYADRESSLLVSPPIDLSAQVEQLLIVAWRQWLSTERAHDFASLEVTRDGGATWQRLYGEVGGAVDTHWAQHRIILDPSYAVSDFRLRFWLHSTNNFTTAEGLYLDDISIGAFSAAPDIGYFQDFEASDGGYTPGGGSTWEWGAPTSGPGSAYSGQNVWATNLSGDYNDNEDSYLESVSIPMGSHFGQTPVLIWRQWLETESGYDYASVEVENDIEGLGWEQVYGDVSGYVDSGWTQHFVVLDPSRAAGSMRVRFHLTSDSDVTAPGIYLDDVMVAFLQGMPAAVCDIQPGGLVVGNVYNQTSGQPLFGARISHDSGVSIAFTTPNDPAVDDAFFIHFAPAGDQTIRAAFGSVSDSENVTVLTDSIVWQDFILTVWELFFPLINF